MTLCLTAKSPLFELSVSLVKLVSSHNKASKPLFTHWLKKNNKKNFSTLWQPPAVQKINRPPFVSHFILPLIVLHCGRWTFLGVIFVPIFMGADKHTDVRKMSRRWCEEAFGFVPIADAEGQPGAWLRPGRGPAEGHGAGLHHQRGSVWYTAPLPGPGEDAIKKITSKVTTLTYSCAFPRPC